MMIMAVGIPHIEGIPAADQLEKLLRQEQDARTRGDQKRLRQDLNRTEKSHKGRDGTRGRK